VVLRDGGQALVEQILQGVVINAHDEGPPLEIRPLVSNSLHEADDFLHIRCQLGLAWRHGSAEERDGSGALVKNRANARP
jgi:hypothetical protein